MASDIDKIALARKREALLKPRSKENQKASGNSINRSRKSGSGKIAKPTIDTRKEAAKSAGVGERTYDAGKLPTVGVWLIATGLTPADAPARNCGR